MPQIPMGSSLLPGRGLNSDTGRVFATAIDFGEPAGSETGPGQTVWFDLWSVSSSKEVSERLKVGASASFKMGFEASAEFSLMESKEVNSYYFYALIRCRVVNPPKLIRNAVLKAEAKDLLVRRGWDAFATQYGWEFVEGVITGGSYYALIEIQTRSEAQKRDVGAKLGAHLGPFKVNAELESTFSSISQMAAINVSVTRSGGTGDVVSRTLPEMLAEAQAFPATVEAEPVNILALTADYRSAVVVPDVPPPNSLQRIQQRNSLEDLGNRYLVLRDYKTNLQYVLDHLAEFDDHRELSAQELTVRREEYATSLGEASVEIDTVVRWAAACAEDVAQCKTYTPTTRLLPLPRIGGELLTIRQLEEKLTGLERRLEFEHGGNVSLRGGLGTNGLPAQPRTPGWAGGVRTWDLEAEGSVWTGHDAVVEGDVRIKGSLSTSNRHPVEGIPPGWGGGLHTWDVYAGGTVGAGPAGGPPKSWIDAEGEASFDGSVSVGGHRVPDWSGGGVAAWDVFAVGAVYVGTPDSAGCVFRANGQKQFRIDHPLDPANRHLVHACIEGPENAVFYRGEARLENGRARVRLPDYFEALTEVEGRTVMLTPVSGPDEACCALACSTLETGAFEVRAVDGRDDVDQRFYWEVKAVRADVPALVSETAKGTHERSQLGADDGAAVARA